MCTILALKALQLHPVHPTMALMATTPKPRPRSTSNRRRKLIQVNSRFVGSKVRTEMLHDRKHLVVPVRMIVPGVLNGSNGPLLYPPSETSRDPHDWNGMPIVVRHPSDANGKPISARSASVLNKTGIGIVLSSKFDKYLDAEAWFDVDKLIKVNKNLYDRIANGEAVELSTGLWTQNEPREGSYKGKAYTHIARNYKPDHLAILPDERGACSVRDGCGVNVNRRNKNKRRTVRNKSKSNRGVKEMAMRKLKPAVKKQYIDNLIGNCSCELKEKPISKGPWTEADRATLNSLPDTKIKAMETARLEQVENARIAAAAKEGIVDGDVSFAFNSETGTFDKKVKKQKSAPTANRRKKKVAAPTANSGKPAKMSEKDFLAIMPRSMREDLQFARNEKTKQKNSLIKVILANRANVFKPEYLESKDIEELTAIAALAGPTENKSGGKNDSRFTKQPKFLGNYAGAAGSFGDDDEDDEQTNNEYEDEEEYEDDDVLDIPTLNWDEIAEENLARSKR